MHKHTHTCVSVCVSGRNENFLTMNLWLKNSESYCFRRYKAAQLSLLIIVEKQPTLNID